MTELALLKAVALGGAWLGVSASLMSKTTSGMGVFLAFVVAVIMTLYLIA